MNISLEWLSDFLPGPLDASIAADALTRGGFPVERIEQVGQDTVIDVEVTSNRGDCLSHLGVARELAALLNRPFRDIHEAPSSARAHPPAESTERAAAVTSVTNEASDLCPHYTARVIRGVRIAPSPDWMRRRLEAIGVRTINNVVDVSNYVMFEMGQPLHAFDFDRLAGGRIVVRRARQDEKLVTIDGKEAILKPEMLAIADAQRPVALAGVMGGKDSEVSPGTTRLLLESARFDPLVVRKTARAIVRSDSSYRFERGIDPDLPLKASLRAAQLILDLAGGELLGGVVETVSAGPSIKRLTLRLSRVEQVLGFKVSLDRVLDALSRLRLAPELDGERVVVAVPSYRLDLNIEVDLMEEVARVIGYEQIPVHEEISIRLAPPDPAARVTEELRSVLVSSGYFESITFGWVSDALADDFVPGGTRSGDPLPRVETSVRKENGRLRPSLLPGLLESVRHNENVGTRLPKLFEIGSTFRNAVSGEIEESRRIAWVGGPDLREVRGVAELILDRLAPGRRIEVVPHDQPGFARGASGRIEWGGQPVGYLGKIARGISEKLSLREPPTAGELELEKLIDGAERVPQLVPLAKFPAVERDLSFVVDETVRYAQIETVVNKTSPQWLESLAYVTSYRGKPLAQGTKSVTIRLLFRSPVETLTGERVESSVQRVVAAAATELGATLRT